jgi:beta-lactamase regulating signal transducer with metallopeptidase domain
VSIRFDDAALAQRPASRRRVADALLDTMRPEDADEIEAAWLAEAPRRADHLERGEILTREGDATLAALEGRLRAIHAK